MANITETELRRKLRAAATTGTGGGGTSGPTAIRDGDTWSYSEDVLYLIYATAITNISSSGTIVNQSDAAGLQYEAFSSTGALLPWRGYLFSKSIYASGDPTDYIWEDISGSISAGSTMERYYSTFSGLLSEMGNPDYPGQTSGGSTVPWTSIPTTTAIPNTAFFLAERYTINGVTSLWNVYAVATEENGFGLIPYTITGRNKPLLSSTQWSDDTLLAVSAFTGRAYSVIKEFGYGTTVVITYDDGKLYGMLKKVSGVATWVAPVNYIDGALLVDTSIISGKIADNAITTNKILNDAINSDKIAANAVNTSEIAVGAITANEIQANTIGANQIAANTITAGEIAANAITTSELAAGAVTAAKITAGTITANEIAAVSITTAVLAANVITADKIAANAITASKLLITGTGAITPGYIGAATATDLNNIVNGTTQLDLSDHDNSTSGWTSDASLTTWIGSTYANDKLGLEGQIDGKAIAYFQDAIPYAIDSANDIAANTGDTWYKVTGGELKVFKWVTGTATSSWDTITDPYIQGAYDDASDAQTTADGKIRNFTATPTTPYELGDVWHAGGAGDIKVCTTERLTGAYVAGDWGVASKYTDDTTATSIINGTTQLDLSDHDNSTSGWTTDAALTTWIGGTYATDKLGLEGQIDGKAIAYFQGTIPYAIDSASDVAANTGDTWYNTTGSELKIFKWVTGTGTSSWDTITDPYIQGAYDDANAAQVTADGKIRNFTATPTTPYELGDVWHGGTSGDIKVCIVERLTGSYTAADWGVASKYTDDTAAAAAQATANAAQTASEVATAIANDTTVIDGARITTGTIAANRISSAGLSANQITSGTIDSNVITISNLTPAEVGVGTGATSGSRMVITSDSIKIYDGTVLRVTIGNLA